MQRRFQVPLTDGGKHRKNIFNKEYTALILNVNTIISVFYIFYEVKCHQSWIKDNTFIPKHPTVYA